VKLEKVRLCRRQEMKVYVYVARISGVLTRPPTAIRFAGVDNINFHTNLTSSCESAEKFACRN
jgi:hypothetical protein